MIDPMPRKDLQLPLDPVASELLTVLELLLCTMRHCGDPLPYGVGPTFPHQDSICTANLRAAIRAKNVADKYSIKEGE